MAKENIIIGTAIIILGVWLSLKVITSEDAPLFLLIYTLIITALGITIIVLNKEENRIEQRKDIKTKKSSI